MAATLLMAAALVVQAPVGINVESTGVENVDVAYNELMNGDAKAAVERIKANREIKPSDPTALINLAAAYSMMGQKAKAAEYYNAAIASDERYELQLADGSWMDSRRIARMGARKLATGETLALR